MASAVHASAGGNTGGLTVGALPPFPARLVTIKTGRMNCEEKARLVAEYEAATAKFSEAVTELRRRMGTSAKEEYERIDRVANDARVKSEQARLAL